MTSGFSKRENQVFDLVTHGFTSKEAGELLEISSRTVEKHREHIRQKLGYEPRIITYHFSRQNHFPVYKKYEWEGDTLRPVNNG